MAQFHRIRIYRDTASGEVVFEHSVNATLVALLNKDHSFTVKPGDWVTFISDMGNYTILFDSDSPFKDKNAAFGAAKGNPCATRAAKNVKGPTDPAITLPFKYTFTCAEVVGGSIKSVCLDPVMEIEDGGGGTGGGQ